MQATNPLIDTYIKNTAAFAQPILQHLRKLVHATCPGVKEEMKWGFPHFSYKNDMMCSMAAFKHHAAFGFWKATLMKDPLLLQLAKSEVAMGHIGKITNLKDLPNDKKIISWIKNAMALNDEGIKMPGKKKDTAPKELEIPTYFTTALQQYKKAFLIFDNYPYSQKKEYVQWITEAKTEATRNKRMTTAITWIAEGKYRNWQYEKK
jgi:uncharacterized protein YdeI (YjbR/CyaY-like superfamily)